MPQDLHTLLEDCKSEAERLVAAIELHKSSAELNQSATESLESAARALSEVSEQISPFTELRVQKFQRAILVGSIANTVLLIATLAMFAFLVLR